MSIPKVKIAVLKNLLIFGEKYLPQSVRLLEGGGLKRYLAEFRLNMHYPCVGLPLGQGVRRFEMFEFLSEKINFAALGGSKSSSFEPDTSHP